MHEGNSLKLFTLSFRTALSLVLFLPWWPLSDFLWGLLSFCLPYNCGCKSSSLCQKQKFSYGCWCSPAFCPLVLCPGSSWHRPPCLSYTPSGAAAICILVHGGHSFPSGILSTTLCQDCAIATMDYTALVLGYRNHRALPPCNLLVYQAKWTNWRQIHRQCVKLQDGRTHYWGSR